MITEKRLEELIKQKAKVYFIQNESFIAGYSSIAKIEEFNLSEFSIAADELFETKEEAEFELEFGNITRTETLKLPSWKKMKRKPTIINFMSKDCKLCKLCLGEIVAVIKNGTKSSKKRYVRVCIDKDEHYFERTEKGYIEACELCRKLFLGE